MAKPITYIPVCPEHHVVGPVGYVREEEADGVCPIIAHREPTFAEREPWIYAAFERMRLASENVTKTRLEG